MEEKIIEVLDHYWFSRIGKKEAVERLLNLHSVSGTTLLVHGTDGRVYNPSSIKEWESSGNVEKGDIMYKADIIKKY